jgi:hypothetical protein
MTTTAEASLARKIGDSSPTAGTGPAEQNTPISTSNGAISGAGGNVRLYGTAGTHVLADPAPNAVSLKIIDEVGAAHVISGHFNYGLNTTITFGGTIGNFVELFGDDAGGWTTMNLNGATVA